MGISMSWDPGRASSSADSTLTLSVIWDHPQKEGGNQKYIKEAPHLPQGVEWANYFIFINKTLLEHRHTVHVHIVLPTTTARLCDGNRDPMPAKNEVITVCFSAGKACWPLFLKSYRLKLDIIGWLWCRRREKIKTSGFTHSNLEGRKS